MDTIAVVALAAATVVPIEKKARRGIVLEARNLARSLLVGFFRMGQHGSTPRARGATQHKRTTAVSCSNGSEGAA